MYYLIFFLSGLGVAWGIWRVMRRVQGNSPLPNPPPQGEGNEPINPEQVKKHRENLGQIVGFMGVRGRVANDDVEKMLGVSNATAERYLNELEKAGKIEQIGKTGQSVYYKLK